MAEIVVTKENFEDAVLNSKLPVVLDFWATWCGPCKMLAPELEKLSEKYEGKLVVGKVNVDEQGELAGAFNIQSIPTIILFNNSKPQGITVGYKDLNGLEKWLEGFDL